MKRRWRESFGTVLAVSAILCATGTASARPFTFDDYFSLVQLSSPRISPDGAQVAMVVSNVDEKHDRMVHRIVLVDVANGNQRVISHGEDDVSDPQWSPDGRSLAFTATPSDEKEGRTQIWVLPMPAGAARKVSDAQNGVELYAWRPDGNAFAYVSADDPPNLADIKRHEDLFTVGDDGFAARGVPPPHHLWMQSLSAQKPERLTSGTWSVYSDTISWSSDGKYIAFTRLPGTRFDDILRARVAAVDVATGRVTQIGRPQLAWMPAFSPSGYTIAYAGAREHTLLTEQSPAMTQLEAPTNAIDVPLDRDVNFIAWFHAGTKLALAANDRVSSALWFVSPPHATTRVDLGAVNFEGGSVAASGAMAFIGSTSGQPGELYYLAPNGKHPTRLTNFNAGIASLDLARTREFVWRNAGFEEDGVLTYPLGFQTGKKYPLVLVIHGGPTEEASTTAFSPLVQILASHGFFVLQPNYRGSDNLGFTYAHAIVGYAPPQGAGADCVAAVKALEATGMIDASRIGVSGWSAGGWLTSWLITHYNMWKAAMSGAGIDDAVIQYSMSEINSYMPYLFGGRTPWRGDGMAAYRNSSPVTHATNVHAATLILSDTTDQRVPTPQAYEFFSALRDLGKTVKFIAIPASGHHPSDPVRRRAVDRAWVDWMVQYLTR